MLCARGGSGMKTVIASEAKRIHSFPDAAISGLLSVAQELLAMTVSAVRDYTASGAVAASSHSFVASSTCDRTSRHTLA